MKIRPPKDTDQEQIEEAFRIIQECVLLNPQIEISLWAGAFWSILVDGYSRSGMSYEQFSQEWDRVKQHYKSWFDK